jgi:hypothetical protein
MIEVSSMHPVPFAIEEAVRRLWGRHPNAGLARALGVPIPTAKSWLNGSRRMPASAMKALADFLREQSPMAWVVEAEARVEARRIKPRRGFFEIRDWDGTGVLRNAQWRGGRSRKTAAR